MKVKKLVRSAGSETRNRLLVLARPDIREQTRLVFVEMQPRLALAIEDAPAGLFRAPGADRSNEVVELVEGEGAGMFHFDVRSSRDTAPDTKSAVRCRLERGSGAVLVTRGPTLRHAHIIDRAPNVGDLHLRPACGEKVREAGMRGSRQRDQRFPADADRRLEMATAALLRRPPLIRPSATFSPQAGRRSKSGEYACKRSSTTKMCACPSSPTAPTSA